ncbi:MAG: hypothetical protein JWO68_3533, partial [Actinomycetia bacterium]|nr:hypothetical protein [Actinomycetes bacterium]
FQGKAPSATFAAFASGRVPHLSRTLGLFVCSAALEAKATKVASRHCFLS